MSDPMNGSSLDYIARARLAARLHDPPEKALILMRTRDGHEGGTVQTLLHEIFPEGVAPDLAALVKRADHWASAADRAAFPNHESDGKWPAWQQVRFAEDPVLIHPLSGQAHSLQAIANDIDALHAQALGSDHLRGLIHRSERAVNGGQGEIDATRTALAFWRFGPELQGELANLWRFLPADSRVPDHTIHDHLDLTAAIAGSFAADGGGPALFAVSIGPVQDFISAARSTSDLWSGSHLLSRLSWEAMRVVCEAFGPESVIFPRLRGIPQVDLWLQNQMGLRESLFADCDWRTDTTDANPLFGAALPNRFTAMVPADAVPELARRVTEAVRTFARERAEAALARMLDLIGEDRSSAAHAFAQIERQLAGFPEVHWSSVQWSLVETNSGGQVDASDPRLADAMRPFFGEGHAPGFLSHPAWLLLSKGLEIEKGRFWSPNPGALYPALHELLDRALSAVKASRDFSVAVESGWRCALTGETEWISLDPRQLETSYRTQEDTLWARVHSRKPSWARRGEHLGALPMLKRIWPDLFVAEVSDAIGLDREIRRFVVSTHTMALASAMVRVADPSSTYEVPPELAQEVKRAKAERVALPRKLAVSLLRHPQAEVLRRIPGWLEALDDEASTNGPDSTDARDGADRLLRNMFGSRPDAYYGLLMLDGDRMGAWLSADPAMTRPVKESFHPHIRTALESRFDSDDAFRKYAETRRAPNPAWHMAISEALNNFALHLAPDVIEKRFLGRLIYAGGDDVLAMLSTNHLMSAASDLRAAYSGATPQTVYGTASVRQANGWAKHEGRLLRLMGGNATASCGLVIAHHQAPLGAVMRELRVAEKRAKGEGGRDAWSLTILKRSGGTLHVTARWGAIALFDDLRKFLGGEEVSRRAAYNVLDWFADVPADKALVESLLSFRMRRQSASRGAKDAAHGLAQRLSAAAFDDTQLAVRPSGFVPMLWLRDFMLAAEFLARETRHGNAVALLPESSR